MSESENKAVYIIPDNFIDEGRIVRGMFRTRYFAEGVIMALVAALLVSLIPLDGMKEKITAYTLGCAPFFLLGITGIDGDPVFAFVKNYFNWHKKKGLYFYNGAARALAASPVENMMEAEDARVKLVEYVERMRKKREESRTVELVEGVDFEFVEDKDLAGNYADEYEDETEIGEEYGADEVQPAENEEGKSTTSTTVEKVHRAVTLDPTMRSEDGDTINREVDKKCDAEEFGSWEDEVF